MSRAGKALIGGSERGQHTLKRVVKPLQQLFGSALVALRIARSLFEFDHD
jgi:hypothetical protein